jgi:hypothetical protein
VRVLLETTWGNCYCGHRPAAVRSYVLRLAGQKTTCLAWLDAMLEPDELARAAEARLRQVVALRDTQGAV